MVLRFIIETARLIRASVPLTIAVVFTSLVLPVVVTSLLTAPDIMLPEGKLGWLGSRIDEHKLLFISHVAFAVPSVLFGPFLLSHRARERFVAVHRTLGKAYIVGCVLSGLTVIPLAIRHGDGWVPQLGFTTMASVWVLFSGLAWRAAATKRFVAHRRWAWRSYALTLAFVHVNFTFRVLWQYLDPITIKVFQSMISWTMNLVFVEVYLAFTNFKGTRLSWKAGLQELKRVLR